MRALRKRGVSLKAWAGLAPRDWAAFAAALLWVGFWVAPGAPQMLAALLAPLSGGGQ